MVLECLISSMFLCTRSSVPTEQAKETTQGKCHSRIFSTQRVCHRNGITARDYSKKDRSQGDIISQVEDRCYGVQYLPNRHDSGMVDDMMVRKSILSWAWPSLVGCERLVP